jgi:predicted AAA+ superfamily ATPase
MYRPRTIEPLLRRYLGLFPAVAVTGPRQSGKSTLVRHALSGYPYVSMDDPEEIHAAERDPRGFLARFPERVIIDEAQRAPGLFSYIKMEIDAARNRKGRFILTGSNQFSLASRISDSLAGRVGLLSLLPFERIELPVKARSGQMLSGSYPELAMRGYEGSREWYKSYLGTYLERDVRAVHGVGKLADFQSLLSLLAARTAQEYNASGLARELGVDYKTVESWVSILEASYILFRLRPWKANIGKRLVKRPKLYFWDTGLVCHLSGLRDGEALDAGPLAGPIFENYVCAEILKAAAHRGRDLEALFYRESNGLEADLILTDKDRGAVQIIEMKTGQTPKGPWMNGPERVAAIMGSAGAKRAKAAAPRRVVVYKGETKRDWPAPGGDFINYLDFIEESQSPASQVFKVSP